MEKNQILNAVFYEEDFSYVNNDYFKADKIKFEDGTEQEFDCEYYVHTTSKPGNHGVNITQGQTETVLEYITRAEKEFGKRIIAIHILETSFPDRQGDYDENSFKEYWEVIESQYDWEKLKRRCRDSLNKTQSKKDILKIAELLNVRI